MSEVGELPNDVNGFLKSLKTVGGTTVLDNILEMLSLTIDGTKDLVGTTTAANVWRETRKRVTRKLFLNTLKMVIWDAFVLSIMVVALIASFGAALTNPMPLALINWGFVFLLSALLVPNVLIVVNHITMLATLNNISMALLGLGEGVCTGNKQLMSEAASYLSSISKEG